MIVFDASTLVGAAIGREFPYELVAAVTRRGA